MSGSNSTPDNDWVRLNVGGKIFETTKFTLSQHPESFLARLVNGGLSSKQDKSGAFLIDRSYKHFDTILNYLRSGSVNFDRSEKAMKDLLCEADFYNIEPLVDEIGGEIRNAMRPAIKRSEIVKLYACYPSNDYPYCNVYCSETHDDYEVLRAFRDNYLVDHLESPGAYWFPMSDNSEEFLMEVEVILRSFGFVEDFHDANHVKEVKYQSEYWKYVRTVSK